MKENIKFKGKIERCVFNSESYKIYAANVDTKKYPELKLNKYGNVCISGNLHELGEGIEYDILASEECGKNGYSYNVKNITRNKPSNEMDTKLFLSEILTFNQVNTLYSAYPNIVEKIINNDLDDIDLSKTKGIKENTFNKIKEKIVENFCLAEIVSEFQGLLTFSMVKKLYEKYPSIQIIKTELRKDPYKCLCGLARVGFKTADAILLEIDRYNKASEKPIIQFDFDLKTSKERCLSCLMFLLEENENNGNTKMSIQEIKKDMEKLVPLCSSHFIDVIKNENIYYSKKDMSIALKSTYEVEFYIANKIKDGLNVVSKYDINYHKYQFTDTISLTDEQLNALKHLCEYNISILNGFGGSGKSQTTSSIIKMLEENKLTYKLFSPTGKAAKVLSDYTGREATTIHRGLGYIPPSEWSYNEENKLDENVVIIDEFSMVDIFLFTRVLNAIDFNRTKLLLVGDNAQLSSVSCGNLMHDFMESNIIPTSTLTRIFRYGEGGLMKVATDVRECRKYLDSKLDTCTFFGSNKDYAFINVDDSAMIKNCIGLYKKLIGQGYKPCEIQVLTSYKKGEYGSLSINNHLQKIANDSYGNGGIKFGDTTFYKNDIVIQNVNNYKAEIYIKDYCFDTPEESLAFIANGETGIITEVFYDYVLIDFDGIIVKYTKDMLSTIGLGYSITIHKSQGSNVRVVILLTPKSHIYMLNSNLVYVGLTRMKERCYHIGNASTVNQSIKKKENLTRYTSMQELLML